MASKTTTQPLTINTSTHNYGASFDLSLSPSEPGKFDFYRVHLNNHVQQNNSMVSDNYEAPGSSVEAPKRWSPFSHIKRSTDQPKTVSSSALYCPTSKSSIDTNNLPQQNKPMQTVASFSALTDAVKNAMQRGHLNTSTNQLRRPASGANLASNGLNHLSSKELNHLSPQSM